MGNTILVDDDKSWVLRGQKDNFLSVPGDMLYELMSTFENNTKQNNPEIIDHIKKTISQPMYSTSLLSFYKLVYITGVLETALTHKKGVLAGLKEIQLTGGESNYIDCKANLYYYRRGFIELSKHSENGLIEHFPKIEEYFK